MTLTTPSIFEAKNTRDARRHVARLRAAGEGQQGRAGDGEEDQAVGHQRVLS